MAAAERKALMLQNRKQQERLLRKLKTQLIITITTIIIIRITVVPIQETAVLDGLARDIPVCHQDMVTEVILSQVQVHSTTELIYLHRQERLL